MPPSACRNLPSRSAVAPVYAPFTEPKSSLSMSSSGMAAQLTLTKGLSRRSLWSWQARATSSLPVPLSPRIRIRAPVGATRAICSLMALTASDSPIIR